MKYYFITYQANTRTGSESVSIWNEVIDISPMQYIKEVESCEDNSDRSVYINFVVINTLEISKGDYLKYKNEF